MCKSGEGESGGEDLIIYKLNAVNFYFFYNLFILLRGRGREEKIYTVFVEETILL
jgi:hypothetical protein